MKKYMLKSLKLKITLPIVLLYVAVSAIIYGVVITSISKALQDEFASKGKSIINALASSVQETILNNDPTAVQNYIDKYRDVEGISFIIILDEHHNLLAHTFYPKVPPEYLEKIDRERELVKNRTNEDIMVDEEIIAKKREMVLSRPILNGLLGHIYVGMGVEKREKEITMPLIQRIVLILLVSVALAIFATIIFLNVTLKPITDLTNIAESYSNGNEDFEKIDIGSEDEVGKLAKNFYLMMDKITENKHALENELKNRSQVINEQKTSLVHASKMSALGEMAGGIAHEINTPLAIIGMKIEQINDALEEKEIVTEEIKASIDVIKLTAERIAKIVKGLRFFARDGGKLPMEKSDIDKIVEDTFSFCREKMRLHGVKLELLKVHEKPIFINCRAVEISQVLLNLLNNAHDAIADQKEKWIQLAIHDLGDSIKINVIDSGAGIPSEIQEKIMQPFFTTKDVGKGTGLGLSISKGIIDSHNGKFYIDNESPNTKFTIILPKSSFHEGTVINTKAS
jgi:signal transduction histidine kinase